MAGEERRSLILRDVTAAAMVTPVTSTHVSPARTSRKDTFSWGEGAGNVEEI